MRKDTVCLNAVYLLIRYLSAAVPGIASIQLSDRVDNEALYVFHFLLLLAAMQLRDRFDTHPHFRAFPLLFLLEAGALTAMAWQYGGLLPLAVAAAVFTPPERSQRFVQQALLTGAAMNAAAYMHFSVELLVAANLAYAVCVMLLIQLRRTSVDREETESLYWALQTQHRDLEEARRTVLDYAAKVEELTQNEERSRIAHDLHDDLGHRLIRLKMMLEAALRIDGTNGGQAAELVREVRDQLGGAMESLRKTVRRMKPAESSRSGYSLEALIRDLAESSGVLIRYETAGTPYPLYPSDTIILYRNAQEAITNALRHGQATEVVIALEYGAEELRMTVSNNGTLPPEGEDIRRGLGLLGMEERVRLVGGRVQVVTGPRFAVRTILPRREGLEGRVPG